MFPHLKDASMTAPNNLRSPVSIMAGIARRLGSAENLPELLS